MNNQTNPLDVFEREAPEVAKAFDQLIVALKDTRALDAKTKQLVYIGIKSALGDATAIYYHVSMAKKLGATRDEIKDTILITLTVCGLSGVAACLPVALAVYDKPDENIKIEVQA
ncbi:MAG: carboxymuconolactone decarboxylase family protein [Mucilaginibacter sp.]